MARYPTLPYALTNTDLIDMYNKVRSWGDVLVQELDSRDLQEEGATAQTIFRVTTVTEIGGHVKGDVVYTTRKGKCKGYVSLGSETSWQDLNEGNKLIIIN